MNKKNLYVMLGVLIGIVFCLPYIIFKEQIQELALIGYIGLVIACALSTVSILMPSSSTIITIVAAGVLNPFLCVLLGALGATIGEQSSYICGRIGRIGFEDNKINNKATEYLARKPFFTVFMFAFFPLPIFDIAGVAAGAIKVNWFVYSTAAFVGKLAKFVVLMLMFWYLIPLMLPVLPDSLNELFSSILDKLGLVR